MKNAASRRPVLEVSGAPILTAANGAATVHFACLSGDDVSVTGTATPEVLLDLAARVTERLDAASIPHRVRFVLPSTHWWWGLAVDLEDGVIDDLFASPGSHRIGIVPDSLREVSLDLAADYVLMRADALSEAEWWERLWAEERADAGWARLARRERWRRLAGKLLPGVH